MTIYDIALKTHIALGTVALVAFWITAALPKGTPLHRRLGAVYFIALLGVIATALPLAAGAFAAGHTVLGLFLAYLVVITGTALWSARRAIERRASVADYVGRSYRPVAWLNLLAGGATLALGIANAAPLLAGMAVIGLAAGTRMLVFAANPRTDRHWWLRRHYIGVVGSGVATHIAFLNLGLRHLLPAAFMNTFQYLAWFGPAVAGVLAVRWLDRRYRSGLAPRAAAAVRANQY